MVAGPRLAGARRNPTLPLCGAPARQLGPANRQLFARETARRIHAIIAVTNHSRPFACSSLDRNAKLRHGAKSWP